MVEPVEAFFIASQVSDWVHVSCFEMKTFAITFAFYISVNSIELSVNTHRQPPPPPQSVSWFRRLLELIWEDKTWKLWTICGWLYSLRHKLFASIFNTEREDLLHVFFSIESGHMILKGKIKCGFSFNFVNERLNWNTVLITVTGKIDCYMSRSFGQPTANISDARVLDILFCCINLLLKETICVYFKLGRHNHAEQEFIYFSCHLNCF